MTVHMEGTCLAYQNIFLWFHSFVLIVLYFQYWIGYSSISLHYNKPWFDEKCIQLRKLYLRNLKFFNNVHSHFNRRILVTSKRNYKNYDRKREHEHIRYKIEYLMKENPKDFYTLFRKKKGNSFSSPDVSDFNEYFLCQIKTIYFLN